MGIGLGSLLGLGLGSGLGLGLGFTSSARAFAALVPPVDVVPGLACCWTRALAAAAALS